MAFTPSDVNGVPPAEIPIISTQDGSLQSPNLFIPTQNPEEAEIFLFPYYMDRFLETMASSTEFSNLPYYDRFPQKHVFFSDHDSPQPYGLKAIWFRASLTRGNIDPNAVAFPYGIDAHLGRSMEDPGHIHNSETKQIYDTSFVGCLGKGTLRHSILESVSKIKLECGYTSHLIHYFGGLSQNIDHRSEFLKSLAESLTVLCPRGAGTNLICFYENALSLDGYPSGSLICHFTI